MSVLNLQEKHSILNKVKKNLRKVAESLYTFLTTCDELEKYVELIKKVLGGKIMKR